ncbi:hypothetical protein N8737_02190 [Verrucomicrobia bacterium]|nr:hypothetical protein [Verrucomicrobiota bacterium]MDA7657490.1 hypothetical protein [Verrucomicrobiota bacterium]
MKALFVYEYGRGSETMFDELLEALEERRPEMVTRVFHGLNKEYVPGGLRPARILSMVYMYLFLPVVVIWERPSVIFVRSSPPCIQLWAQLTGSLVGSKVGTWLMDYHPEIECRALNKIKGFRSLGWLVRFIDRKLMSYMDFVVVLDGAMRNLVSSRCPELEIIEHPTWGQKDQMKYVERRGNAGNAGEEFTLVYGGNLGLSHPLETLFRLVNQLTKEVRVRLVAVGASVSGEKRLRRQFDGCNLKFEFYERIPFLSLATLFHERRADIGVVLLGDETAGLVSPSKFSAYLRSGLPILYIGPMDTSSDLVCASFGAGISIRNGASDKDLESAAQMLLDRRALEGLKEKVPVASEYFGGKNGKTLAEALEHVWPV